MNIYAYGGKSRNDATEWVSRGNERLEVGKEYSFPYAQGMILIAYPDVNDNDPYCLPGLKNENQPTCIGWSKCGKSGTCPYCGTGKCCAKGHPQPGDCGPDDGTHVYAGGNREDERRCVCSMTRDPTDFEFEYWLGGYKDSWIDRVFNLNFRFAYGKKVFQYTVAAVAGLLLFLASIVGWYCKRYHEDYKSADDIVSKIQPTKATKLDTDEGDDAGAVDMTPYIFVDKSLEAK